MKFSYVNATQIQFGQQQILSIPSLISKDKKILVIYGGGSIKNNGVYKQVCDALADYNWIEFSGVEPNPTAETLNKAVTIAKENNIDFILAVGGGSVIDGAKYVAAAARYSGEGWDILTNKHTITDAIPIGAVLTLPATGSESNQASVITMASTKDKLAFLSPFVQPKFAIMDPDVMKSLPDRQIINGIVDSWVHICEQYITYPCNAMVQDGYAEVLLKNLRFLSKNINNHNTDNWRSNLMWTANQALNGLIGAGVPQDWATHMLGHELTALFGVDHARSLAIIQPSLLRNQIENKQNKLSQMGRNVFSLAEGADLALRTIDAIESFYRSLGVETQLTEYSGTKEEAIETIIAKLEKHHMTTLGENQNITLNDCRQILNNAIA